MNERILAGFIALSAEIALIITPLLIVTVFFISQFYKAGDIIGLVLFIGTISCILIVCGKIAVMIVEWMDKEED